MAKEDLREKIAAAFIAGLEQEQLPWQKMWQTQRAYNAVTETDYRGINSLWLSYVASEKGYADPRWCTFKQASDQGWHVNKGERGTQIEFYSIYDTMTKKTLSVPEAVAMVKNDPDREKDLRHLTKTYTVFNAEQIAGIPKLRPMENNVDIDAIRANRDTLLKNMELEFHEGGDQAFYLPDADSITMPPDAAFESTYAYMSTFLHEAGHATGHPSRLNRDMSGGFGSEKYAKEELRAEIASAFTAQALGFGAEGEKLAGALDNHKAYIQSWIKAIKEKPTELFAAIKDAGKISDYLIDKGEFERVPKAEQEVLRDLDETIAGTRDNQQKKQETREKTAAWSR